MCPEKESDTDRVLTLCQGCWAPPQELRAQPRSSPCCKLSLTNHAPPLWVFYFFFSLPPNDPVVWPLPPFGSLAQMSLDLNRTAHTALISVPLACLIFFQYIYHLVSYVNLSNCLRLHPHTKFWVLWETTSAISKYMHTHTHKCTYIIT